MKREKPNAFAARLVAVAIAAGAAAQGPAATSDRTKPTKHRRHLPDGPLTPERMPRPGKDGAATRSSRRTSWWPLDAKGLAFGEAPAACAPPDR